MTLMLVAMALVPTTASLLHNRIFRGVIISSFFFTFPAILFLSFSFFYFFFLFVNMDDLDCCRYMLTVDTRLYKEILQFWCIRVGRSRLVACRRFHTGFFFFSFFSFCLFIII